MEKNQDNIDFYAGFESEPELRFSYSDGTTTRCFLMWIGYFDQIMDAVEPSPEGWDSLAYYYQLNEGWYQQTDWTIPDLAQAIVQIQSVNLRKGLTEEVRLELIQFLQGALSTGADVVISYF